jgi:uncharacterized protein (DUF1778 family)
MADFAEYVRERNKTLYDYISLRILKGDRSIIKAAAESEGRSINEYIVNAINEHEQHKSADYTPVRHKLEKKRP